MRTNQTRVILPLSDYEIYEKYRDDVRQIKHHHKILLGRLPKEVAELASYYLEHRLKITNKRIFLRETRTGRVFPYIAFWLSDALGLSDKHVISQLALGLTYAAIFVSIRDDLIDGEAKLGSNKSASLHTHIALANWYYDKYYQIFASLFASNSPFWQIFSDCMNEWSKYETWSLFFKHDKSWVNTGNPLSQEFLEKSSSYLFAITLPTLAAISILTNKDYRSVREFLKCYCMAFRIADDLRDWKKDLVAAKNTDSCVILYTIKKLGKDQLTFTDVESMFLDPEFVRSFYGTALRYLDRSRTRTESFESPLLKQWLQIQKEYLSDYKQFYLSRIERFRQSLAIALIDKNPATSIKQFDAKHEIGPSLKRSLVRGNYY